MKAQLWPMKDDLAMSVDADTLAGNIKNPRYDQ